jgi:polyketide cyclase/dehydrase/lipid transport protein
VAVAVGSRALAEWTPTVDAVDVLDPGETRVGTRVCLHQPRLRPAVWVVDRWQPGSGFCMGLAQGSLRTRASHGLVPAPDGGCEVALGFTLEGLFAPFAARLGRDMIARYLALEAAGLKARCEIGPRVATAPVPRKGGIHDAP